MALVFNFNFNFHYLIQLRSINFLKDFKAEIMSVLLKFFMKEEEENWQFISHKT